MTGTSKTLTRLGVTGLGAALAFAGLVPLTAVSAYAAPATSVAISPTSDTAAVGTCNAFTATVSPNGSEFQVNITQGLPSGSVAGDLDIGFCNPTTDPEGNPTAVGKPTGNIGGNTTANSPTASQCTNATDFTANPPAGDPNQVSCTASYDDTSPALGDGKVIFGVTSNTPGSMSVTAFSDNGTVNGVQDVGEPGQTATKSWVANTATNTNKISCTPPSATNDTGDTHEFKCTVTDANGVALPNQDVGFVVTQGPDAGVNYDPVTATGTGAPAFANCDTTGDGTAGSTVGEATCEFTNNGTPGKDTISAYEDTNGTSGQQNTEPSTTITKDFVTPPPPAPTTSQITVTCSPNPTNTENDICQDDPTNDDSATFTATVTNGVPAQPVAGVRVEWTVSPANGFGNTDAGDTETLSVDQCITNASGQCSTVLTDSSPQDGESFDVDGEIDRGVGGFTDDDAVKNFIVPDDAEARNVTVEPATATQDSGGAQEFLATVTDRFGNPVNNAFVFWDETGPGDFRGGNDTCDTDEDGQCSIEVESLPQETGDETVTADISDTFPNGGDEAECHSPAGFSNYDEDGNENNGGTTPNANGQNEVAPGATAGNCTDTGVVTWTAPAPPQPTKKQHPDLNCKSPKKHVLKCHITTHPRVAGIEIKFKKVHKDGTFGKTIKIKFTNSNGETGFKKKHIKSGKVFRVVAHAHKSPGVKGGYSNVDKTTIK